jgi:adenine-specific DNA-methyltransferase
MIKYLGSKRKLLPAILRAVRSFPDARTVIDLFSGTSRVGHALKRAGYRVLANDHNAYAHALARCYVQADREDVIDGARKLVAEFNRLPGSPGYFTETFCVKSRFFQPKNGARVDRIREAIAEKGLEPDLEAVMLVSLMEAADRVDSTTGLQMAYLKTWAPRAHNDLELRVPDVLPRARFGKGAAYRLDALEAVNRLEADVAYIDPPYNQHSYLGNYHVWETLVRWDKPEVYGVACKRLDCRSRRSVFNSRPKFYEAMSGVARNIRAPILIVSFNNEGYLAREDMEAILRERGSVGVIENDYKRYVGAQIGIWNPKGAKVGKVSHLRNKENLYVVAPPERVHNIDTALEATGSQLTPFD